MKGWAVAVVVIIAHNHFAEESMCGAYRRLAARHPAARVALLGAWGVLTVHVHGVLPDRYDPLTRMSSAVSRVLPGRRSAHGGDGK